MSDEEIEAAFKMFDRDNSGTINHNEIKFVSKCNWFLGFYETQLHRHVAANLGLKITDEQITDMMKVGNP